MKIIKLILPILLLITYGTCSKSTRQPPKKQNLALTHAIVIDGMGNTMPDATVIVADGRITQISPSNSTKIPPQTQVIDVSGKWIVPGFVDTHIHVYESGRLYTSPALYDFRAYRTEEAEHDWIRKRLPYTLSRFACAGVTAIAELSGPFWSTEIREKTRRLPYAPRMATAGRFIGSSPFGEFNFWSAADPAVDAVRDEAHARELVREQLTQKPELIKTGYVPAPEQPLANYERILRVMAEETHRAGLRLAVHAFELDAAKAAIRAGADILAHTPFEEIDQEFIDLALKHDVIAVSSIAIFESYEDVAGERRKVNTMDRNCGDPQVIATWEEVKRIPKDKRPVLAALVSDGQRKRGIIMRNLKRMYDAGIRLSTGSDAGNVGLLHGASIHREFELLAEAGVDPMGVLVAATKHGSQVIDPDPDFGVLAAGKVADLLVLGGDPLVDVRNLARIEIVVNKGYLYRQSELHADTFRVAGD